MSTKQFREAVGMSHFYYSSRMAELRYSFTLNDVESMCAVLGVTELEVATMAARLKELAPVAGEGIGRG